MTNLVISSDFNLANPQDFFGEHAVRSNQSSTSYDVDAPDLGNFIRVSGQNIQYNAEGKPVSGVIDSIVCITGNGQETLFNLSGAHIDIQDSSNHDFGSFGQELSYWLGSSPSITTIPGGINGSQTISAPAGDNEVFGYTGHNTIAYSGASSNYNISTVHDDWQISGDSGVNMLHAIQRASFSDTMVGLDTGAGQHSGEAFRIYQAAFDRAPEASGVGYWINRLDNGADLTTDVAQNFINSKEFQQTYGPNLSNNEFINLLYNNVLNRGADQGGLNYWNDKMDHGMSRASVLANFSESAENIANTDAALAHGVHYQMWLG